MVIGQSMTRENNYIYIYNYFKNINAYTSNILIYKVHILIVGVQYL